MEAPTGNRAAQAPRPWHFAGSDEGFPPTDPDVNTDDAAALSRLASDAAALFRSRSLAGRGPDSPKFPDVRKWRSAETTLDF